MIETIDKRFENRDIQGQEILDKLTQRNLTHISTSVDTENFTKSFTFKYKEVLIEVSVRVTSNRFPVLIVGKASEMLFKQVPPNMTRTADGIRIGTKGKSYPKTIDHVLDQITIIKNEIDKKVETLQ